MSVSDDSRKMEELISVICEMSSFYNLKISKAEQDGKINENVIENFYERLKVIYTDGFRHEYHIITKELDTYDSEQRETLCQCIGLVRKLSENPEDDSSGFYSNIKKLQDHIELEHIRKRNLDSIKYDIENYQTKREMLEKQIQEMGITNTKIEGEINAQKNQWEQIKNDSVVMRDSMDMMREQQNEMEEKHQTFETKMESFNAQSITILGIFSGLVIGFATASDVLVAAFANLPTVGILDMSIFLILTGFVLFNVIFFLMLCIGRLTGQFLFAAKKPKKKDKDQKESSGKSFLIYYNIISLVLIVALYMVRVCLYVIDFMPIRMFAW